METLEAKLIRWFNEPAVRAKNWLPSLFWHPASATDPFGALKVDAWELEVLFATLLGESATHFAALNSRGNAGFTGLSTERAEFIAANARRHELPLLSRAVSITKN